MPFPTYNKYVVELFVNVYARISNISIHELFNRIENIVAKVEIANYEQYVFLTQCFQNRLLQILEDTLICLLQRVKGCCTQ